MSDRPCNLCVLNRMKRDSRDRSTQVVVKPSPFGSFTAGVNVYQIRKGEKPTKKNWVCWFALVPSKCEC